MLLQRDIAKAAQFYSEGLGLRITVLTERWAELQGGPSDTTLALKASDRSELPRCPAALLKAHDRESDARSSDWVPRCPCVIQRGADHNRLQPVPAVQSAGYGLDIAEVAQHGRRPRRTRQVPDGRKGMHSPDLIPSALVTTIEQSP